MTPEELREAVARAIEPALIRAAIQIQKNDFAGTLPLSQEVADAAIATVREALREPTAAMWRAGLRQLLNGDGGREIWRAMLAASALGGPRDE